MEELFTSEIYIDVHRLNLYRTFVSYPEPTLWIYIQSLNKYTPHYLLTWSVLNALRQIAESELTSAAPDYRTLVMGRIDLATDYLPPDDDSEPVALPKIPALVGNQYGPILEITSAGNHLASPHRLAGEGPIAPVKKLPPPAAPPGPAAARGRPARSGPPPSAASYRVVRLAQATIDPTADPTAYSGSRSIAEAVARVRINAIIQQLPVDEILATNISQSPEEYVPVARLLHQPGTLTAVEYLDLRPYPKPPVRCWILGAPVPVLPPIEYIPVWKRPKPPKRQAGGRTKGHTEDRNLTSGERIGGVFGTAPGPADGEPF